MLTALAPLTVRTAPGVAAVPPADWDALTHGDSPFVEHAFLAGLEATGSVGPETAWRPKPLLAYAGEQLVGAAPAYVKTDSMGEFVYDWAWADAARRIGVRYYPKLVIAAPFSPVGGRRLLTHPSLAEPLATQVRGALLAAALELADQAHLHGVHVLFCAEDEVAAATELGFAHRLGVQLHWRNEGYRDFDDFLGRFSSKRRNQIRRERRRVREAGVDVRSLAGAEVEDAHLDPAFRFYVSTVEQFAWGRQYLSRDFFEHLWRAQRERLHLTLATHEGRPIAGAVDLAKAGRRYGRYWGADATVDALHFEVCAYAPIEDAIRRGLGAFEAGAGNYEHKLARGFLPAFTHSVHWLAEPRFFEAVADFCAREAAHVRADAEQAAQRVFVR